MTLYCTALKRPRVLVLVAKQLPLLLHSLVSTLVGQVQLVTVLSMQPALVRR